MFFCSLIFLACEKKETLQIDSESQTVIDYVYASQAFNALPNGIYRMLLQTPSAVKKTKNLGETKMTYISGDTLAFTTEVTYSCTAGAITKANADGNERTGSIRVALRGPADMQYSVITATLDGFYCNNINYQAAVISMTTIGESARYFSVQFSVENGIGNINGKTFTFNCDNRLAIYYGGGPLYLVPYFSGYGSSKGTSRDGLNYDTEVEKDFAKYNGCDCISEGLVKITPSGYKEKTINFGEGQCDQIATFTVAENTISFKLK